MTSTEENDAVAALVGPTTAAKQVRKTRSARAASALLLLGVVLLTVATSEVAHIVGVIALLLCAVLTFEAVTPTELGEINVLDSREREPSSRRADEL